MATSTVTFREETVAQFWPDAELLFPIHWEEIAVNQDRFKQDMDRQTYEFMESAGRLSILAARAEGILVGYVVAILMPHLHYKSSGVMALTDLYFLHEDYRNGSGAAMMVEWEKAMRKRGVVQLVTSTKVHRSHLEFWKLLGFRWTDYTLVKVLA